MKILKITFKNLKLLMRSKTTMFVVLFGPLIIMLLVGFAFNNPSSSVLNIGYYGPEKTNLTESFVNALQENNNFLLEEFSSQEVCINMIEQGNIHICMVFPENFTINNNQVNEVIFYADKSRANFVYAVLDTVSEKIDLTSNQLSYQMTSDLLSVIASSQKTNSDVILKIINLKATITTLSSQLDSMSADLGELDLSPASVETEEFYNTADEVEASVDDMLTQAKEFLESSQLIITELDEWVPSVNGSDLLEDLEDEVETYENDVIASNKTIQNKLSSLVALVDTLSLDIEDINSRLASAKDATGGTVEGMDGLQANLEELKTSLDGIKSTLEKANAQINALKITSAESIVNPIRTRVEPITSKTSNLNFLFPYLVILIIAFISIMLSSTIIIIEKTSKAYFRNFTTPTKDLTFISSVFLTSFLVVSLQLVFILILAYYFLKASILSNVLLTLVLIFGAMTLFTLIGMIIGYFFNSQEAVTMASISVGSVFLFLSNLVLPLETMSAAIQQVARYNPYVISSELLKQLTLFTAPWNQVSADFLLLGIFIVVAFVLTMMVEKASKFRYISKKPVTKIIKRDDIIDKFLKLKNGITVKNETELLVELRKMSDISFQQYVDKKKNDFETWLLLNGKNDLAKIVGAARTRKEMITAIEEYLRVLESQAAQPDRTLEKAGANK